MYKRPLYQKIVTRLEEPRDFIQVLAGPCQTGKSTLAYQIKKNISIPTHYVSTNSSCSEDAEWLETHWECGRKIAKEGHPTHGALLIIDEAQKIPCWAEKVKKLWDEDTANNLNLKVMLLGSSTLLLKAGLDESLTGRFEVIPITHWSFQECRDAFGLSLKQYIYFGGYPGSIKLIKDEIRWAHYIREAIINPSLSRDVCLMSRIHKPALLRRIFELGCHYTGHILSYQKIQGQMQDAGNQATLAHYLEILSDMGLVGGLKKFYPALARQKASTPKFQVFNTALSTAQSHLSFAIFQKDEIIWRQLIKATIGAHLINSSLGTKIEIFYWKEGNAEIDFVIRKEEKLITLVIDSIQKDISLRGVETFSKLYHPTPNLVVGKQHIPIDTFLLTPIETWMEFDVGANFQKVDYKDKNKYWDVYKKYINI